MIICMPHRSGDEPMMNNPIVQNVMSMPHRSGDEPQESIPKTEGVRVCPTGVGMNRVKDSLLIFPTLYAPQEWG